MIAANNFVTVLTPKSSSGKCSGKSTNEKRVWSGRANDKVDIMSSGSTSMTTLVFDGTGTGELSRVRIQVSNCRISSITGIGIAVAFGQCPMRTDQTAFLKTNKCIRKFANLARKILWQMFFLVAAIITRIDKLSQQFQNIAKCR